MVQYEEVNQKSKKKKKEEESFNLWRPLLI